jgi:hypothetical protein
MTRRAGGIGSWIIVAFLVLFLLLAIVFMVVGWDASGGDVGQSMTTAGYVAMAFGVIVTLALGTGLMALVYYSNRKGHD